MFQYFGLNRSATGNGLKLAHGDLMITSASFETANNTFLIKFFEVTWFSLIQRISNTVDLRNSTQKQAKF